MSDRWDDLSDADAPADRGPAGEDDPEATTFFAVEEEEEELVFEITGDTDPYGSWPTLDPGAVTPVEPTRSTDPAGPTTAPSQTDPGMRAASPAEAGVAGEVEYGVQDAAVGPPVPAPSAGIAEHEVTEDDVLGDGVIGDDVIGDGVIEDEVVEDEVASVEHVAGEIHVPDGYTVLEGAPVGRRRAVGVIVSRFNGSLTDRLLARAIEALEEAGVAPEAVTVVPVPGAFELPLAAMALAKTRRYSCIVALGAIVRGETPHFDLVAGEAASGLQLAGIETGVPVAFGVLAVETIEQAEARIDRAADAVATALEMADMFARLRASTRAH